MRFRYFDSDGTEIELSSVDALEFRIGTGAVTPETLLYDAAVGEWAPAGRHAIFRFLVEQDEDLLPEESRAAWEQMADEPVLGETDAGPPDPGAGMGSAAETPAGASPGADPESSSSSGPPSPEDLPAPAAGESGSVEDDGAPGRSAADSGEEDAPEERTSPPEQGDPLPTPPDGASTADEVPASPSEPVSNGAVPEEGDGSEGALTAWWGGDQPDGGRETREPDGSPETNEPDGGRETSEPDGSPETNEPDGGRETSESAAGAPSADEEAAADPDPSAGAASDTRWLQKLGASTGLGSGSSEPPGSDEPEPRSTSPEPAGAASGKARKTRLRVLLLLLVLFGEVLIAGDMVEPGLDALAANRVEMRDVGDVGTQALGDVAPVTDRAPSASTGSPDGPAEPEPGEPVRNVPEDGAASAAGEPEPEAEDDLESLAAEVSGAAFRDLAAAMTELQEELSVEERPPEIWLDGAYLADAQRYPEVGEYWSRYGSWVASVRALEEELYRGFVQNRVLKMGLDTARAAGLSARTLERYGRSAEQREQLYADLAALAEEATALHGTLVERSDAISYEPFAGEGLSRDPVVEAVAEDPELAERIWSRLDRIFDLLERVQGIRPVSTFRLQEALLEGLEMPDRGS